MTAANIRLLQLFVGGSWLGGLDIVEADPRFLRGLIYVRLNRLESQGYLESRFVTDEFGRRLQYSLTAEGVRIAETGYLYDIPGRRLRMKAMLSMDAPSAIIRGEAWLLVYGYAGGPWRGVWWCFKETLRWSLVRWRDRLLGPPGDYWPDLDDGDTP